MSTTMTVLLTICLSSLAVLGWLQLSVVLPRLSDLSNRRQGPTPEEEAKWAAEARMQALAAEEAEIRGRLARMREHAA
jgi:hypothetical protein